MKKFNALKFILCLCLLFIVTFTLTSCDFEDIKDKGEDIWDNIVDKGEDVWNDIVDKGEELLPTIKEIYGKSKDKIIELYGTAKEGAVYVYSEAAEMTEKAYEKASEKAKEIIGDVEEYIEELKNPVVNEIKYALTNKNYPLRDLYTNQLFNETDSILINKHPITEKFITYYISSILAARGYSVYNGAVYYKNNLYGGIIFTKNDVFIEEEGKKIYSCGFIQLVDEDYSGVTVTDKMVQSGLIAVSTNSYGNEVKSFIVDEYATFDDFSGIFYDTYFKYTQSDNYVLRISIKDNLSINYDSNIELYDFDYDYSIYAPKSPNEVYELYKNDKDSYEGAKATVNALVDVEDSLEEELSTVFVLDGKTLDKVIEKASTGTNSVKSFFQSVLNKVSLNGNQFLSVDEKGNYHVLGSENAVDESRVTNGLISTIGSGLATAGTVASIVCTCQSGILAVSAIVITTGTSAIVYNISNMLTGVQDVYYGASGDISESQNPVLNVFKTLIPDEKAANLIYHIWGAANSIITNVMIPVSKALNIAKVKGLNAFQTTVNVVRASVVTVAKALATGIGAGIVSDYVNRITVKVLNDENIAKLAGFGASLISGMLIYKGLDAADQKLDVSGLYPKTFVRESFDCDFNIEVEELFTENISSRTRGEDAELVYQLTEIAVEEYGIENSPTIRIVYDSNSSTSGSYDYYNNVLTVNMRSEDNTTLKGLADTIGHEMRHAWQYQVSESNPFGEMAQSLNNYISPKADHSNYYEYRNQLCESDAWNAGEDFAELIMAIFGK